MQDHLSGICDDLRLSSIDSVFGHIATQNPYFNEISETIHGLIIVSQAFGNFAYSLIPLVFLIALLKEIASIKQ